MPLHHVFYVLRRNAPVLAGIPDERFCISCSFRFLSRVQRDGSNHVGIAYEAPDKCPASRCAYCEIGLPESPELELDHAEFLEGWRAPGGVMVA
jgi:hypothetical protein